MTMVRKRTGGEEPYQPEKVLNTLAAASDELDRPLNASDLKYLVKRVSALLEGRKIVDSQDIYVLLVGVLYTEGHGRLAEAYVQHRREAAASK